MGNAYFFVFTVQPLVLLVFTAGTFYICHLFSKYSSRVSHAPGTVLGPSDTTVEQTDTVTRARESLYKMQKGQFCKGKHTAEPQQQPPCPRDKAFSF